MAKVAFAASPVGGFGLDYNWAFSQLSVQPEPSMKQAVKAELLHGSTSEQSHSGTTWFSTEIPTLSFTLVTSKPTCVFWVLQHE